MTGRSDSSNTFRHAIHTHGEKTIGTEKIAISCQHSTTVARKHYIHKSAESTAFPEFFQIVVNSNDKLNIEDWVAVVYDRWYIGQIMSTTPLTVKFLEEFSSQR